MTIQAKHFIEPSDIIGLRFECNKCHSTISMVISPEVRVDALMMCPNCQTPWLGLPGSSDISSAVKEFIGSIVKMSATIKQWNEGMAVLRLAGFAFSLEIQCPMD
jgi:hypothetical protein